VKKADVLPAYLAWYLNQRPAQVFFEKHAGGTRIQVVNKQVLGEFEVEIPEFSVQEKIVKVYELHQRELFLLNSIKNQRNLMISVQLLNIVSD
jgi:restriction endonuclease S subunit